MTLRHVNAIRYISSLREGGSLPALVEADDGMCYVVKLKGAGQGPLALVAEIVSGEIARRLQLPVPEIVLVDLDPAFARQEPDPEIQDLFRASRGLNVGLQFLSGVTVFDPASGDAVDAGTASRVVWLDAFTLNVDRTARNANLLVRQGELWLIDHGASLYFHHHWSTAEEKVRSAFPQIRDHILLPYASETAQAAAFAQQRLSPKFFAEILEEVPDAFLVSDGEVKPTKKLREAYLQFFSSRLHAASSFEQEIERARA